MASADLWPIWQRIRKRLLHDRSQREEAAIRSREEEQEEKRERALAGM